MASCCSEKFVKGMAAGGGVMVGRGVLTAPKSFDRSAAV
jgi:hypothetical protein